MIHNMENECPDQDAEFLNLEVKGRSELQEVLNSLPTIDTRWVDSGEGEERDLSGGQEAGRYPV